MRPRLVFAFILLACSSPSLAQNTFGVRAGVSAATLTGDFFSADGAEQRVGLVVGIYGAIPLRYGFMLQPEILYTQKGFKPTDSVSVSDTEPTVELTYIEMPVLLKYPVYLGSLRLDPYAGPFVGFELSERLRIDEVGDGTSEQTDNLVSPDAGFMIGSDLNLSLGTLEVVLGARYARGVRNLLEPSVAAEGRSSSVLTSTFSLFVGLNL